MKIRKSLVCLALAVCLVLPLASCSNDTVVIAKFKDTEITSNMFSYMISSQKAYLEQMFYYYYQTTDFDSLWATEVSGEDGTATTYGDTIFQNIVNSTKMFVVVKQLCKEYGLDVTDQSVVDMIEGYISEDVETAGNEDFLNIILSEYGADISVERDYLFTSSLSTVLLDYLYGDNGTMKIPDTDLHTKFENTYAKVEAVAYSYQKYDEETSSNVDVTDTTVTEEQEKAYFDENYVKAEHVLFYFYDPTKTETKISDEEIAAKKKLAQEVFDKITNGELTFDDAKTQYNEDPGIITDASGKCFTTGVMLEPFEKAVFEMEIGDIQLVETDVGMHIIRKNATADSDFTAAKDAILKKITQQNIDSEAEEFYNKAQTEDTDFSKVSGFGSYEEGALYTSDDLGEDIWKIVSEAKVGDVVKYQTSGGTLVIRRLALTDDDYQAKYDTVWDELSTNAFYDYIESFYSQVEMNNDELAKYSFAAAKSLTIDDLAQRVNSQAASSS